MKVTEFRMPLPLEVDRYQVCQRYMVAKASIESTEAAINAGTNDGIEILKSEPFETAGGTFAGRYTHKNLSIASKVPTWISSFVDAKWLVFEEKSWDGFPKTKTVYECSLFPEMQLSVESMHVAGGPNLDNAVGVSTQQLASRYIVPIDIVNDIASKDTTVTDLSNFICDKANFGPLNTEWQKNDALPRMTCYKVLTVHLPYFGWLSGRVESWVVSAMQDLICKHHRNAIGGMEDWCGMSLTDVRAWEAVLNEKLAELTREKYGGVNGVPLEAMEEDSSSSTLPASPTDGTAVYGKPTVEVASANEKMRSSSAERNGVVIPTGTGGTGTGGVEIIDISETTDATSVLLSGDDGRLDSPTADSTDVIKLVRAATLYKLGEGFLSMTWNPRHVVVQSDCILRYYVDQLDKPKDEVPLNSCCVTWTGAMAGRLHSFSVQTPPQPNNGVRRILHFSGESEAESRQWMLLLQLLSSMDCLVAATCERRPTLDTTGALSTDTVGDTAGSIRGASRTAPYAYNSGGTAAATSSGAGSGTRSINASAGVASSSSTGVTALLGDQQLVNHIPSPTSLENIISRTSPLGTATRLTAANSGTATTTAAPKTDYAAAVSSNRRLPPSETPSIIRTVLIDEVTVAAAVGVAVPESVQQQQQQQSTPSLLLSHNREMHKHIIACLRELQRAMQGKRYTQVDDAASVSLFNMSIKNISEWSCFDWPDFNTGGTYKHALTGRPVNSSMRDVVAPTTYGTNGSTGTSPMYSALI
eukprot:Lankesteria_metandrocarpae@DN4558_c0_g1_i1.p1